MRMRGLLPSAALALAVVLTDQASKAWAAVQPNFVVTFNKLGSGGLPWLGTQATGWLIGSGLVLSCLAGWAYWRLQKFPDQWPAWGLVLGGGVGNWLDRWQWPGVRDWLVVPGLNLKNNLADYAITVGVIWLMIYWPHSENSQPKKL